MSASLGLRRDTSGAMMIVGLFGAVLVTALLYYVIGIGDTIVHRETMQDSADAGAFSAAVVHARGMNLLVLINLIMAAVLAVLIALKLVLTITLAAIVVCIALAYPTFGASLSPVPTLANFAQQTQNVIDQAQPRIFDLLRAGRRTAHVVRRVMPSVAGARAIDVAMGPAFSQHVSAAVPWPIPVTRELPTEDDRFEVLCDHAGRVVGDVVTMPFAAIPGIGPIRGFISSAIGALTSAFSSWFCGAGGSSPPSMTQTIDTSVPMSPAAASCDRDRSSSTCEAARRDEEAARPTAEGNCPAAGSPGAGWCEERSRRARHECGPGSGVRDYSYQRVVRRRFFWRESIGGAMVLRHTGDARARPGDPREQDEVVSSALVTSRGYPSCSPLDPRRRPGDPEADLCERVPPRDPPGPGAPPVGRAAAIAVEYESFPRMHACVRSREVQLQPSGDRGFSSSSASDMAPQRLRERLDDGTPVHLGGDPLQIRFFVFASAQPANAARGVGMAAWGRPVSRDAALGAVGVLGEIAVSQGEFFYPSTDLRDRPEWMWNMRWQARLREFVAPTGGSCGAAGGACSGGLSGSAGLLDRVVGH